MLIKFRLKNFKSYKDLQEFSMIAGNSKQYLERVLDKITYSLLKFSAIYGANGSGKTNLIDALSTMQKLIVLGRPNFVLHTAFKLDDISKKEPTYFETILLIDEKVYSYGFEFCSDNNKFTSEWLTLINGKKDVDIFTRDLINGDYKANKEADTLSDGKLNMYLDDMKNDDTKLFLNFINSNKNSAVIEKNKSIKMVYDWFNDNLVISEPEDIITSGDYFMVDSKIKELANLLNAFGTGIQSIKDVVVDPDTAYQSIPRKMIEDLQKKALESYDHKIDALMRTDISFWHISVDEEKVIFKKVCFFHDENQKYPFILDEESSGTIRLIDIAETLLTNKNHCLFVIDELDRKLHPQLTCKFIEMFLESCKKNDNQLIVSTHESRLLDFNLLRRDEIWFANKEKNGESKIYSLEEFNVRFDKKIDKAYLDGRYGGVPVFDTVFPTFGKCRE